MVHYAARCQHEPRQGESMLWDGMVLRYATCTKVIIIIIIYFLGGNEASYTIDYKYNDNNNNR